MALVHTESTMLDLIRQRLGHLPPDPHQPLRDGALREAAVLMALTRAPDPSLVFIKRAEHLSSHGGQVAFPGGMWEPGDASLLHTALRESEEEIALPPAEVEVIASLPVQATRFNVRVTPYVGFIPEGLAFVPELGELESVFQVPLSFLADAGNLGAMEYALPDGRYQVPCYSYEGYSIWGFTLHLVADVLEKTLDLRLPLDYKPLDRP